MWRYGLYDPQADRWLLEGSALVDYQFGLWVLDRDRGLARPCAAIPDL